MGCFGSTTPGGVVKIASPGLQSGGNISRRIYSPPLTQAAQGRKQAKNFLNWRNRRKGFYFEKSGFFPIARTATVVYASCVSLGGLCRNSEKRGGCVMCKTLVPVVVFCLLFLLAASAYSQETVTLTVNSAHGSPTPSVGDHSYLKGTPVTATVATPVGGGGGLIRYACVGWKLKYSSPPTGTTNTVTFTINKNSILTWKWKAQYRLTLNVEPAGAGHIDFYCDSHPEEPAGTYPPTEGGWWTILRVAQLTAVANEGYDFAYWSGGSLAVRMDPTANPTAQQMRRPETITANFTPERRQFTVYSEQGEPSPAVGTYEYHYDDTVTANCGQNPYPAGECAQYICTGHTGTGDVWAGSETAISFYLHHDSSVTWLWQLQYRLTTAANPPEFGTVTPSGETWHNQGAVVTLTAIPNDGYTFFNWSGDLSGSNNPETLTMDAPKSVTAEFISCTDPNPPDPTFMEGAVPLPPAYNPIITNINYTDPEGNSYPVECAAGEVVILFDSDITDQEATDMISNLGGSVLSKIPNGGLYLARVPVGTEMSFILNMRAQQGVMFAEPNWGMATSEEQYVPPDIRDANNIWSWTADERKYLELINAYEAWYLVENDSRYKPGPIDITVAVIDQDFDNIDSDGVQYIDDISQRVEFREDNPNLLDSHGLRVATLLCALGNSGKKPVGINWYSRVKLISIGGLSIVPRFIVFASELERKIGEAGSEVINCSFTEKGEGKKFNDCELDPDEDKIYKNWFGVIRGILDRMRKGGRRNFLAFVAAGNDAVEMNWDELKDENMIVVGMCSEQRTVGPGPNPASPYRSGNYGSLVDIYAPGKTDATDPSLGKFPTFRVNTSSPTLFESGTSFATPVVAGVASLMWEINPNLSAAEIKRMIIKSAQDGQNGIKVLNMYHALGVQADFTAAPTSGNAPLTVQFTDRSTSIVKRAIYITQIPPTDWGE